MNRILAGHAYPTRPVALAPRPVPRIVDPRIHSWIIFSRENWAAYTKADELCAEDFLQQSDVVREVQTIKPGNLLVPQEPSCLTKANVLHKFSKQCTLQEIFDNASEFHHASMIHRNSTRSGELRFPDFFRYGIRFQPSPITPNTFQTLSIMNLPSNITLNELMAKIRGGIVVSCHLLDTMSITGSFSARVRFLQESKALAYDDFAAANPIIFDSRRACIRVVQTPSFPLSPQLMAKIIDGGRTRCLEIYNVPKEVAQYRILQDLRISKTQVTGIEHMQMRKGRVLNLRFSSIWYAERAYAKLVSFRTYRSCRIVWAKDPCALQLHTLKQEAIMAGKSGIVVNEAEGVNESDMMGVPVGIANNDNKAVSQHHQHHNIENSARPPSHSYIRRSPLPDFSHLSHISHLSLLSTVFNHNFFYQNPSTERQTSFEHTAAMCFSSSWKTPDSHKVEVPTATHLPSVLTQLTKKDPQSTDSASSQATKSVGKSHSSCFTMSSDDTGDSGSPKTYQVTDPAEVSVTSTLLEQNTSAEENDSTNITGNPATCKCSQALKNHLIALGIFRADAFAFYRSTFNVARVKARVKELFNLEHSYSPAYSPSWIKHLQHLNIYKAPGYTCISPGETNGCFNGHRLIKYSATLEEHLTSIGILLQEGYSYIGTYPPADMSMAGDIPILLTKALADKFPGVKPAMTMSEISSFAVDLAQQTDNPIYEPLKKILANQRQAAGIATLEKAEDHLSSSDDDEEILRSLSAYTPLTPTKANEPAMRLATSEPIQSTAEPLIPDIDDPTSCTDDLESSPSMFTTLTPTKSHQRASGLFLADTDSTMPSLSHYEVLTPVKLTSAAAALPTSKQVAAAYHTPTKACVNIMDMDIDELSSPSHSLSASISSETASVDTSPSSLASSLLSLAHTARAYAYAC